MTTAMRGHFLKDWSECVSAFLISAATLTSTWCGAQANLASSAQITKLADFNNYNRQILDKTTRAGQMRGVDVLLFTQYANALAEGHAELADAYLKRFRAETRPALEAWLKTKPFTNPSAPATPFAMPEYKIALEDEIAALSMKSEQAYEQSQKKNALSDRYVLLMSIFTMVLFFAGIATKFPRLWIQGAFLCIAALFWIICVILMLQLPVTWSALRGPL